MPGELVSAALILSFTAFAAIFAYLGNTLPDEADPLKLLNYSLTYFILLVIGFMGIQGLNTGTVAAGTLENWNAVYMFILAFVFYYFVTGYYERIWKESER